MIVISGCTSNSKKLDISILEKPKKQHVNSNYISNRAPLQPSAFIKLPVGSIEPEGWLKVYLEKQRDGLTGNLGEISAWLQKEDNAWLSEDGSGEWGWEEVPYWLKGYANLGYILDDPKIIDEAKIWIEAVINGQRKDGNFGPKRFRKDGSMDFWGNMIMLYCLQSYYEYSGDERVIDLMTKYFKFQLDFPEEKFLTLYWQKIRGGDNLHSVLWLYNRTGDKFLLELAEKIHRNTADWTSRGHGLDQIHCRKEKRVGTEWPEWFGDQIDWHNVNHAQCFREPAQYFLVSGNREHLDASYENFDIMREYFGQVPGGMFGSDENSRPGYDDPRQGVETCGIVEQLNSDQHMLRITGDSFWADHAEEVAFNTYPAAIMPDFKSLHYITAPNMVLCDHENHHPGIDNSGPFLMMNPFSSRCCQHNHAQGWPYYAENLWMATPDNGLLAALYSASTVTAKVATGEVVTIKQTTNYPFDEKVKFKVTCAEPTRFPLYLRIPAWCKNARISINGEAIEMIIDSKKYIRINRVWSSGDNVELELPMELEVKTWGKNHNSVSIYYGPVGFSLKIDEEYRRMNSEETAIGDSRWQKGVDKKKWPSWEIYPASAWNYGLKLDENNLESSFTIVKGQWPEDNFPFTIDSAPIKIKASGKKIPEWKLDDHKLCGELMNGPVVSHEKTEEIELIPMGAARLRISAFPVVK
jgi:hypothetical protein